jgi:aryl-alcohol dehydrogenase-like predicted oxidoreductase
MTIPNASDAGRFKLGGDIDIARLGYGAMRITGKGIWGEPKDRAEALRTLRRLPELGVDFIDTADSYGPNVSEELIAEALAPYPNILIATKGGLTRPGPDVWVPDGQPAYLRQCVEGSLRRLKVERIDLWQLHRIDPKVPREDQFGVIADMRKEGLIRHVGLSEVGVDEILAAQAYFPVASVQNIYNLTNRKYEPVVDWCAANGVGFIPWFPLAAGGLTKPGGLLDVVATAHGATLSQIALAWLLKRSPVMLPIPGTSQAAHAEENVAAAAIKLSNAEFEALDAAGRAAS